jgi:hypothetical protein
MMWIVWIVLIGATAGIITDYLKRSTQNEKLRLKQLDKEVELERLKQENYLLENEDMRAVLNRLKEENRQRIEEKHTEEKDKWLLKETKEQEEK